MARTYNEKACNLNFTAGCANPGYMYTQCLGVSKDLSIAEKYFEKALSLNDDKGCDNLSQYYFDKKEMDKFLPFAEKSCRLNNARGCLKVAVTYKYGLGTAKGNAKAREYFKKVCRPEDHTGCNSSER